MPRGSSTAPAFSQRPRGDVQGTMLATTDRSAGKPRGVPSVRPLPCSIRRSPSSSRTAGSASPRCSIHNWQKAERAEGMIEPATAAVVGAPDGLLVDLPLAAFEKSLEKVRQVRPATDHAGDSPPNPAPRTTAMAVSGETRSMRLKRSATRSRSRCSIWCSRKVPARSAPCPS